MCSVSATCVPTHTEGDPVCGSTTTIIIEESCSTVDTTTNITIRISKGDNTTSRLQLRCCCSSQLLEGASFRLHSPVLALSLPALPHSSCRYSKQLSFVHQCHHHDQHDHYCCCCSIPPLLELIICDYYLLMIRTNGDNNSRL